MMPASTNGGGSCAIPGPLDFCKTPSPAGPVPMPYPNFAMPMQASGGTCSSKVKICGKKTLVKGSEIPMSTGDEGGVAGGVVSNMFKGSVTYKKGSGKVKAEGKEVCFHGSLTGQNGNNANVPAGAQVAPSQAKVTVMP
jgi:hypothetical protein